MAFIEQNTKLWEKLSSIAEDEALRIYDLERYGDDSLRVFIQRLDFENVSSDDCSKLCRRLMVYFEVEGPNLGFSVEPIIEVSSPGVNRHLRLVEHFNKAVGERVKVIKKEAAGSILGQIESADSKSINLIDEQTQQQVQLPLENIKKAHVEFVF